MKKHVRFLLITLFPIFAIATGLAQQDASTSLSSGLSSGFSGSSQTSGFNSTFEASASSIGNSSIHSDINDPTHSQLLGSALSPADFAYVGASVQAAPQTGILTDAQSSVGMNDFGFGGHRSRAFTPGAATQGVPSVSTRALSSGFTMSSAQAAFGGGLSTRAAFSGRLPHASAGVGGLPGESAAPASLDATLTSIRPDAAQQAAAPGGLAPGAFTDPVLTGSSAGYDTGSGIHGDLPTASSQAASFFASPGNHRPQYQYDDGQTPPFATAPEPGAVLGGAPEYTHTGSGFPDSTRGTAATAPEFELPSSSFASASVSGGSPFPAVSGGTLYEPTTQLQPSIHVQPSRPIRTFEQYERSMQRARLAQGLTISQSSSISRQDLKDFRKSRGTTGRRSSLATPSQTSMGPQGAAPAFRIR